MREYWINVYNDNTFMATRWSTRSEAITASMVSFKTFSIKTLYRIHVRKK